MHACVRVCVVCGADGGSGVVVVVMVVVVCVRAWCVCVGPMRLEAGLKTQRKTLSKNKK